jgi:hypothetical protein
MTAQQLLDGFTWINDRFYTLRSIARRLSRSPTGLYWTLPLNLRYLYAWRRYGAARQAPPASRSPSMSSPAQTRIRR